MTTPSVLAEIITIGDEILIGQIVDTNSAWMGQELNRAGIKVKQITSVSDDKEHILTALKEASARASIVLITGGLGPTKDDITKTTLAEYFNVGWKFDDMAYKNVQRVFEARGRSVSDLNKKQAEVPVNCIVLNNLKGTAPGMWFEEQGVVYISMPGVPYEMKYLMEHEVIPRLRSKFKTPAIIHRTVLTQGIGESFLSEKIAGWEDALPPHLKLAYLPSPGTVRLRLSGSGNNFEALFNEINERIEDLMPLIEEYVYGFEDATLEDIVGKLLKSKHKTLSTAESCTGGYISHLITGIPGCSAYYKGSVIAYSYDIKTSELGVSEETLESQGAVSEATVREMAKGVRLKLNTDYSIACSGIAGPDGGTPDKPVGTVWIAVSSATQTLARKVQLGDNRQRVIRETALHALNDLRKLLLQEL